MAWMVIVVGLPIFGFVGEGPGAGTMRKSVADFGSGLWEAAHAALGLAIAAAIALSITCWSLFQRYESRSKIPEIMDRHRDYMDLYEREFNLHIAPLRLRPLGQDKYKLVILIAEKLFVTLCVHLEKSFELLTGGKCCASIKSYNPADGTIITRSRGCYDEHKRKLVDEALPSFRYTDNSAFVELINTIDGDRDIYISNWLPFWRIIRCYTNTSPYWLRFYTATVVLPMGTSKNIRLRRDDRRLRSPRCRFNGRGPLIEAI